MYGLHLSSSYVICTPLVHGHTHVCTFMKTYPLQLAFRYLALKGRKCHGKVIFLWEINKTMPGLPGIMVCINLHGGKKQKKSKGELKFQ